MVKIQFFGNFKNYEKKLTFHKKQTMKTNFFTKRHQKLWKNNNSEALKSAPGAPIWTIPKAFCIADREEPESGPRSMRKNNSYGFLSIFRFPNFLYFPLTIGMGNRNLYRIAPISLHFLDWTSPGRTSSNRAESHAYLPLHPAPHPSRHICNISAHPT